MSPRILIVRLSHLGDVVCTLPLLEVLRAAHPTARIAWAVQTEYADLLTGHPALDVVLPFDRRGGFAGLRRLAEAMERFAPDWTLDAQGNWKSAAVGLASRAPRRSGFAARDHQEPLAALATHDAAASADAPHALDRLRALAAHVAPGHELRSEGLNSFRVGDLRAGRALFERTFARPSPTARTDASTRALPALAPVVIHASRAHDVRSWPAEHVARLARELAVDHDVLVVCGPDDAAEGRRLAAELREVRRCTVWAEARGLRELASFLRAAGEERAVFVGSDSGPMHMAWSAGLRVVMLAGPTDERATGPWPVPTGAPDDRHRIARVATRLSCAPCRARSCAHPEGNVCLARLEPSDVARLVRQLTSPTAS